jgi:ABC-type amino acid transport substrate-binding protein
MEDGLERIRTAGVIRIACRWDLTYEQFLHPETGKPDGVVGRFGTLLASDLGVKPEFVVIEWDDQLPAMLRGEVDVCPKHSNVPSRAIEVDFTHGVLMEYDSVVLVREPDSSHEEQWLNQPERRIGAVKGSLQEDAVLLRYPRATLVTTPDNDVASRWVETGKIDAAALDAGLYVPENCRYLSDPVSAAPLVIARDASHPSIAPGQGRLLRWLDNFMDFHTRSGVLDQILKSAKEEHERVGVVKRGWAAL